MTNKNGQPPKKPASTNDQANHTTGNSIDAQRQRVLDVLRTSRVGATTIDLRELHDVMMPAARVHELRWSLRFNIQRIWDTATNAQGNLHRVARYVLLPGKWNGAPVEGR